MRKSKSARRGQKAKGSAGIEPEVPEVLAFELADQIVEDPEGVATELIAMAWEASDAEASRALALEALALDPRASDALLILASLLSFDSPEAMEMAQRALHLAEENMGERPFERFAGRFWEAVETQPYLRARSLLVDILNHRGQSDAAIEHLQAVLDLWPDETIGARYQLLRLLFDADRLEEIERLLKRYPEDATAYWTYGWALLSFKREGRSPASDDRLRHATTINGYAPHYLLGRYRLPSTRPVTTDAGSRGDSQVYALDFLDCWKATPGALEWLREARRGKM